MEFTDLLAIWGALLSTVLAGLAGWRELRDRPRLKLLLHKEIEWREEPIDWDERESDEWDDDESERDEFEDVTIARLFLDVINEGSRPQTVVEAWLALAPGKSKPYPVRMAIPFKPDEEFEVIPPHEARRYTLDRFAVAPSVHVDTPLRAYVVEARGNVSWSEGTTFYRDFLDDGWLPGRNRDGTIPEDLTQKLSKLPTNRIEPRWKLWKPKHLRS